MNKRVRRLLLGTAILCAPAALNGQNSSSAATPAPAPPPPATIGPAQLRDFQLPGQRRIVAQPPPTQPAPVQLSPPSPVTNNAAPARPAPASTRAVPQATHPIPATTANAPAPAPVQATPTEAAPAPAPEAIPAPVEARPTPAPAGRLPWTLIYAAGGGALLILVAAALLRRRRRQAEIREACAEEAAPAPVETPLPEPSPSPTPPQPRPWLELALKAERATSTDDEAVVDFELEISNTGKASASNIRIDVKMFNAGNEQDQEIGAFFRTAGRESTKCHLSNIPADTLGVIRGSVAMPREEMKALKLEDRYLFVPVLAVNALYDYGEERTGQTSKSYVVGRELDEPSEKMGAFRVDQGPRVWRTVGQRQHKLARRV
jgi:hypothetical protein